MSFKNNSNFTDSKLSNIIEFTITENIEKLGIKELVLQDKDFITTWTNGRKSCINFKSLSLSENSKLIEKALRKEVKCKNIDDKTFYNAVKDIEDQLIKRREEILNLNKPKSSGSDSVESQFLKDVSSLREQFEKSSDPNKEWQSEVEKKYAKLQEITIKHYPEAWSIMEFCLAVKSIQNIQGNTTPFIGIILAKPSSLKTTIIELFRKYDKTFYSDSFTPNSMISHNSSLSEEQLQNIDMLPKMHNKFVLTPELAPMFTAKDDDLQKVLGIITRIVDGKGYESDSGAQGHRKYSDIMFSWVGAAVEIPPKVWKLLSQLGFKLYFFRPNLQEKSVNDLITIIKDNDYILKNNEIEEALLNYLKVFDAAPNNTEFTTLDENGIVKVKWNFDSSRNESIDKEQIKVLEYIAQIAKLLASLRGTVYASQSKMRKYQRLQDSSKNNNDEGIEDISFQTEELDYETDSPTIEDPARAGIILRNLAIANAFSHGRNYLTKEDVKLIIHVAFSTTRIHRSKLFELLLKNGGELATSQIVKQLGMSEPFARKTMREFEALEIVKTSATSASVNSELKIRLNDKFSWFLTEEFQKLSNPSIQIYTPDSRELICCNNNMKYQASIIRNLTSHFYHSKTCDNRHMLKQNLPETEIKNKNVEFPTNNQSIENKINLDDSKKIKQEAETNINNSKNNRFKENMLNENLQKNGASLGSETFQHVTLSQNCHKESVVNIVNEIVDIIKTEKGSISLGYALQLACQKSELVRDYLRDEKLTARDSRKVRNLLVDINRQSNIQTVKRKPELVVKWIEKEEVIINN